MGKRKGGKQDGGKGKRFKFSAGGFIDPNSSGIYATCNRGKEQNCRRELMMLFQDKAEQWYDLQQKQPDNEQEEDGEEQDELGLSMEEKIEREIRELREARDSKTELFKPIDLGCECLVFIKTRKPIEPGEFVLKICQECAELKVKTTRYTQRLTPISFLVTPTMEELKKLCLRVLAPHFHQQDQKPCKFAISVTKRNFNAIPKPDIIRAVAECVGRDHGHSVDLKQYDKLILVEGFKSNIGMSVVEKYDQLERFNLQQIFDKSNGIAEEITVKPDNQDNQNKSDTTKDPETH